METGFFLALARLARLWGIIFDLWGICIVFAFQVSCYFFSLSLEKQLSIHILATITLSLHHTGKFLTL